MVISQIVISNDSLFLHYADYPNEIKGIVVGLMMYVRSRVHHQASL